MTNASNVGIDKHSISSQVRLEWPHNLLTYFQERGRGSRLQGERPTCILFGNLLSYIYLMSQIILTSWVDSVSDQVTGEVEGFNSAILPSKHGRSQQPTTKKTYPLGPKLRHCLREGTTSELLEVIHFFVLTSVANTHMANHIWQLAVSTLAIYLTHGVAPFVLSAHRDGTKSSSQFIV